MHSGFRLALVLVAGALVGAFGLVVVLLLSGLEIPAIQRDVRDSLGPAQRTTEAGGPLLLLRVGPVPGDVATEIVGELTLAGFTARGRSVATAGRGSQVISVGPHPQAVIDAIAERLREEFPAVGFTVTYAE